MKRAWLIRAPCSNCINRDFGPSVDQDSWHTYSRQRTLNKRGALTLWHNESNTLSDRTIFTVRIDSALSDDRRLCSTTLSWYTLIRTHCDATNALRANDLDVHICLSRNDFTKAPETRTGTWCTRLLCQPMVLDGPAKFASSPSRRRSDSCPKYLEERLRATNASSQLNGHG